MAVDALLFAGFQTCYNNFLGVPPVSGNHTAGSCPSTTDPIEVFTALRFLCHWLSEGPLKLRLMFVRKIADFRPPKWPYTCPGIADFRSEKAKPCPRIADLGLDRPKFFGGR
jgi:hypothetical protein